jgi:predicted TIM-barrel fold metal-dependent hydrolase
MADPLASTPLPRRIDMHVHMVSNGAGGKDDARGWLRLGSAWHRWLASFMLRQLGVPADALEGDLDAAYAELLLRQVRSADSLDSVVLLAHEQVYDDDGTLRRDLGTMFVPNDLVLALARKHPEFLAGASIHPARADAIEELERCAAEGAVLMKCLPNCQNIDCSEPRYRPFWEKMAALGLPLLAHTGGEHTVQVVQPAYADPRLLRLPLECGMTVIAAHCATRSGALDRDHFSDWVAMLREFPNLYGDISALISLNRCGHLRDCLQPEIAPRILQGSDFPVPVLGHRLWLQRWIDTPTFRRCQAIENPLERDWQFKRALGFGDEVLTRAGDLLRRP